MTGTADEPQIKASLDSLMEGSLRDIGIPPRPAILERISSEMLREEPDYKRLATIIGADVALSAGLIKTANSPFFGYRIRARTINEALMLLGLDVASRALAGIILRRVFPNSLHLERFWDASARIARVSGWLARRVGNHKLRPDDAYTFGLFRDCGIPVLMMRFPEYRGILARANSEEELGFTAIEEAQLPTNHAIVGCMLAHSWWLPEEIYLAIRYHHDSAVIATPSITPPLTSRYRIAISQFAEHLVQRHTGLSHTHEWPKLGEACLKLLDIAEDDIEDILAEAVPVIAAEE
ncbi:MAG: HDOD domain-containing protein [Sulfuritalea sp.]|nr:HDOD domain-containing protein [Sulfuritalea sp.]